MTTTTFRPAAPTDGAMIAAIYRPYVVDTAISFEAHPPTGEMTTARMLAAPLLPWWVAIDGETVVGYAYASPHRSRAAYRWSVEVSVYLAPSEYGRGLGTGLYQRLLPELAGLGYVSAYAGITLPNRASVLLHERVGFAPVGVFPKVGFKSGVWHDVGWWHLLLRDPPAEPMEPASWVPPRR